MTDVEPPPLIGSENIILTRAHVVSRVFPIVDVDGSEVYCIGSLWITNYRIIYKAVQEEHRFGALSDFEFPLGWIAKIEKAKSRAQSKYKHLTQITTHFGWSVFIRFPMNSNLHKEVMETINRLNPANYFKNAFCFANMEDSNQLYNGWLAFKFNKEFARMALDLADPQAGANSRATMVGGVPQVSKWKLSVPFDLQFFPNGVPKAMWPDTYPSFGVVEPMTCSDTIHFGEAARVREDKQVPFITWGSPYYPGVIMRGMQLLSDETMTQNVKYDYEADVSLMSMYNSRLQKMSCSKLVFVEVGSTRAPPAAQQYQKEVKCDFQFLTLPSNSDLYKDWVDTQTNYLKRIDQAPWWHNVDALLRAAHDMVLGMVNSKALAILGSRRNFMHVPLLTVLQILIDPFYRSLEGIAVLIQKEWVDVAFPFHVHVVKDKGSLPHFELLLSALWTLLIHFPSSFEYNEQFIMFLLDNIMSHRFGTFLGASARENEALCSTPSIFSYIMTNQPMFRNPHFIQLPDNTPPAIARLPLDEVLSSTLIWTQLFLRNDWELANDCQRALTVLPPGSTRFMAPGSLKHLSWLPPSLFSRITTLSIPDNKFFSMQWEMLSAQTLEDINMSGNPLTVLPLEFLKVLGRNCPNLRVLVLDKTRCGIYPSNVHICIPSLKELHMKSVAQAPRSLVFLSSAPMDPPVTDAFQTLDLSNNNLSTIAAKFINVWSLTSLDLSSNAFDKIPPEVSYLNRLRELRMSMNRIAVFTGGKLNMFALDLLDLSYNGMHSIPDDVSPLLNLRILDLSFNNLKYIPESFFMKLRNLESLNLSQNKIVTMPASIGTCDQLIQLDLSYNQLETVPEGVTTAVGLQILDLSHNRIRDLPVNVARLKQLRSLNVTYNCMRSLPVQLGLMADSLQTFMWEGNPLEIQQEVLAQGGHGVLEFLRDLMKGASPCFRMKLMIVGEENVGKSTLTEQLVKRWHSPWSEVFVDPNKNISTDGVDISSVTFEWENDGPKAIQKFKLGEIIPVSLSLWDFGGQTVYYTTHQFFLSERSLFLVLYNLERPIEDSRVDYWLNSIQSKVRAASVIVVGTHLDGLKKEKRDELDQFMKTFKVQYRTAFPSLDLAFQAISARSGEGVPELKDLIEKRIMNSKNMGEMLPESYLLLEKSIIEERSLRNPPILAKSKFLEMGHLCNIKDERELWRASSLLHNLGTIIYFDKDPTLSQYVILNPHFLARVFSTLITTKHRFTVGGMIPHSALAQIWRDFPRTTYSFLLQLLEKFEVIYSLSGDAGKFIIPEAARRTMNQSLIGSPPGPVRHTIDVSPGESSPTVGLRRHTVSNQDSPTGGFKPPGVLAAPANRIKSMIFGNGTPAPSPSSPPPAASSSGGFIKAKPSRPRNPSFTERGLTVGSARKRALTGPMSPDGGGGGNFAAPTPQGQNFAPNSLSPSIGHSRARPVSFASGTPGAPASPAGSSFSPPPAGVPSSSNTASTTLPVGVDYDPNGYSLVPSALEPQIPEVFNQLWSPFPPAEQNEVSRAYYFSFLPQGFFSRLMVRLLQRFSSISQADNTVYWQNGLLLLRGQESILAQIHPEQLKLDIFVRGGPFDQISPLFCAIIEAMSLLLREWGSLEVSQYVYCSHCRRNQFVEPTEFPIEHLTGYVRAKVDTADCIRVNGGLQPASPEVMERLFQSYTGRGPAPGAASPIAPQQSLSPAPPPAPAAAAPLQAADMQKQMDDFQAQLMEMMNQMAIPLSQSGGVPVPGAVALPGMASPTPMLASPMMLSPLSPPPVGTGSRSPSVEDASDLDEYITNPVKRQLLRSPDTVAAEVRLDLLVPDLKLVYLKGNLVKWDDLAIEKQIGRGGFAVVYKGTLNGEVVAIKKLDIAADSDDDMENDSAYAKAFAEFRKEAFVMTQITDPHCVVLKGVCLDPFALITEFVPYGDLYSAVNKPEKYQIDWPLRLKIALDMAKGMLFMHSQKPPIIHNDLKTPNVLMMSFDPNAPVCAKVSDFGLSMQVAKMYKRLVDNPVWLAPEIMMGQTYTGKADVYAYGVMLWELLERKQYFSHVPFNSDLEIRAMAGERSPITQDCMPEYEKLIRMCWEHDPSKRPDFGTVVKIVELLIKKLQMGLAQIGPSSEARARSPTLTTPVAIQQQPPAAQIPAAVSPPPVMSQPTQEPISAGSPVLSQPGSPSIVRSASYGTRAPAGATSGSQPQQQQQQQQQHPQQPSSPEQPPAIVVSPQPMAPQQPLQSVAPMQLVAPTPAVVPEAPVAPPPPAAPTFGAVSPRAMPTQPAPQADQQSQPQGPMGVGTRVAVIGGSGASAQAFQSIQEQLRANVKRAPSMSGPQQTVDQQQQQSVGATMPAGAPKKMMMAGGGPGKMGGAPGKMMAGGAPGKMGAGGPPKMGGPPAGGLKKFAGPPGGAPKKLMAAAPAPAVAPEPTVQPEPEPEPTPEPSIPEGALSLNEVCQMCQEIDTCLKTGTMKSFAILKILSGDETREADDHVEKAIVEVVQLVKTMKTACQTVMELDTSFDAEQFSRQQAALESSQGVINALLAFCRTAKALDGAQRGLLTAHDIGDIDVSAVQEKSAEFAASVKATLMKMRPIKEWFSKSAQPYFVPSAQ